MRLPRGRHPLRGPFGQMLDDKMSKSDLTRNLSVDQAGVSFLRAMKHQNALAVSQEQQQAGSRQQISGDESPEMTPGKCVRCCVITIIVCLFDCMAVPER